MAESREKSERERFEQYVVEHLGDDRFLIRDDRDPDRYDAYLTDHLRHAWEAGRRDALEEAIKAICYHCRMGIPVDPLSESLSLWHRDPNSGRLDICTAAAIRALKEKGKL